MNDADVAAHLRERAQFLRSQADEFDTMAERLEAPAPQPTAQRATRRVSNARRQSAPTSRGGSTGKRGRPPKAASAEAPTAGKRGRPSRLDPALSGKAHALRGQGKKLTEIAEALQISLASVSRLLAKS